MKSIFAKNNWMHFTLALGLTGVLTTAARAESFAVQVPFAFEASGRIFPAGAYSVDAASSGVLTIRGATSADMGAIITFPAIYATNLKPSLVFDRGSDLAVLSRVNLESGLTLAIATAKRLTATLTLPPKGSVALSHP
jgi:hypothetical protein